MAHKIVRHETSFTVLYFIVCNSYGLEISHFTGMLNLSCLVFYLKTTHRLFKKNEKRTKTNLGLFPDWQCLMLYITYLAIASKNQWSVMV